MYSTQEWRIKWKRQSKTEWKLRMYRVYKAESISVQVIFTDFGPNAGSTYRQRALWYGSGFNLRLGLKGSTLGA